MKIKIKIKIKLYDSLINIILIIGAGIPLIVGGVLDTWRTVLSISIIVVTFLYIGTHKIKKVEKNQFLFFYILCVFIIVLYEIIKGKNTFNYSSYETFYALRQYIWIIMAVPLYFAIVKGKSIDKYLKTIIHIVFFSLGLRTLTWFCKNFLNVTVFYNLLYEYGNSWGRDGRQRIDATALIGVLIPLLFYFYKKYREKKYLLEIVFVLFYLLMVSQTRTLFLGALVCIGSMFFFAKRTTLKKLFLQIALLLGVTLSINAGVVDYFLKKLNITLNDGSVGYRQYEFAYYSSLLANGRWKTGLGIITSLNKNGNKLMYGNLDTQMYLDDLGIFECFFQFGLFSIILYGVLLFYIFYVAIKCNQVREDYFTLYLIGQFFYIVIVSLPLNLFGIQRIFSVPVILAIVCAIHNYVIKKMKGIQT